MPPPHSLDIIQFEDLFTRKDLFLPLVYYSGHWHASSNLRKLAAAHAGSVLLFGLINHGNAAERKLFCCVVPEEDLEPLRRQLYAGCLIKWTRSGTRGWKVLRERKLVGENSFREMVEERLWAWEDSKLSSSPIARRTEAVVSIGAAARADDICGWRQLNRHLSAARGLIVVAGGRVAHCLGGTGRTFKGRARKLKSSSISPTPRSSQPLLQRATPSKRIALPVRVEPKVFFANERTFLSWLNFSVVLGGLAVGLLNFGDKVGKISAGLFTVVAMGIMMYALVTFHWRANAIRKKGSGPYDDRLGPTVIALSLFAAMVTNIVLRFTVG